MARALPQAAFAALCLIALAAQSPAGPPRPNESVRAPSSSEAPDVGRYETPEGGRGFVLQREGNRAALKFEDSDEVLALTSEPAAMGDRLYKLDTGEVVLRATSWGGLTLFAPDARQGLPVDRSGDAAPLALLDRLPPEIEGEAANFAAVFSVTLRTAIPVSVDWAALPDDAIARATLYDSIANARAAVTLVIREDYARAALVRSLKSVRFQLGETASSQVADGVWTITCAPGEGVAGRLSSAALAQSLNGAL
jgi:hypothetical protein